jgi:hypothetical protein
MEERNRALIRLKKIEHYTEKIRLPDASGSSDSMIMNLTPWEIPITILENYYDMTKIRIRQRFFRDIPSLFTMYERRLNSIQTEEEFRSYSYYAEARKQTEMIISLLKTSTDTLRGDLHLEQMTSRKNLLGNQPTRCLKGFGVKTTHPVESLILCYLVGWSLLSEVCYPVNKFLRELYIISNRVLIEEILSQSAIRTLTEEDTKNEESDCIELRKFEIGDEIVEFQCHHKLLKTSFTRMCEPILDAMKERYRSDMLLVPMKFKCPLCRDETLFTFGHLVS